MYVRRHDPEADIGERPLLAGRVKSRPCQETDLRLGGLDGRGQLSAIWTETRTRPVSVAGERRLFGQPVGCRLGRGTSAAPPLARRDAAWLEAAGRDRQDEGPGVVDLNSGRIVHTRAAAIVKRAKLVNARASRPSAYGERSAGRAVLWDDNHRSGAVSPPQSRRSGSLLEMSSQSVWNDSHPKRGEPSVDASQVASSGGYCVGVPAASARN